MQIRRASLLASAVTTALMLAAAPVTAADKPLDSQPSSQKKPADARSAKDAEKQWEQEHRTSKIVGSDIMNVKGEKVGTVKDLIIDDPASGQVTRVVVSVGGMGGLGDKLFAVPYNELQRDPAKNTLVLNKDSDLAHAFNNDNWQALGDQGPSSTANASSATPAATSTAASTPASDTSASTSPASSSASPASSSASPASSSADTSAPKDTSTVIGAPGASDTTTPK